MNLFLINFMADNNIKIRKDNQDRTIKVWLDLLSAIGHAEFDSKSEFKIGDFLDEGNWNDLRTLPREIGKLKKIKHLQLSGTNLQRFPQEIGNLESLEVFTPYTSYGLRWFPFEITRCKNLKSSTVSTRALFGNKKTKKSFPSLQGNPVKYYHGNKCSICNSLETNKTFEQYWITLWVGSDALPLLAIVCSNDCYRKLPEPLEGYFPKPHKGGDPIKEN